MQSPCICSTIVAPAAWYHEAASYVGARGLMTGTSAAEFSPAANMTRAMVWTVFGRLDGADVSGSGGNLNPNGTATRAEAPVILMRFCENVIE